LGSINTLQRSRGGYREWDCVCVCVCVCVYGVTEEMVEAGDRVESRRVLAGGGEQFGGLGEEEPLLLGQNL
jgi:hypothetical protein